MARLGVEINIFGILTESDTPMAAKDIAARTGVELALMGNSLQLWLGTLSNTFQNAFSDTILRMP